MPSNFSRRVSRRRRRVYTADGPEQLETRRLLTAEISGSVFHDTSGDGQHDANEAGITGAVLTLTGTNTNGDAVTRRFLTDDDGAFRFDNLDAGTYEVTQTQPSGISDGQDSAGDGADVANDRISNITVGEDDTVSDLQFGEGVFEDQFMSLAWLLASANRDDVRRDLRADMEEEVGSSDVAELIREGVTEVDDEIELNDAPETEANSYSTIAGEELIVSPDDGLLQNDSDPEGEPLTASLDTNPENGSVSVNEDGSFTYTPTDGFIGTDTFTYVANDGFRDSAATTVTIEVGNPNTFTVSESTFRGDSVGTVIPLREDTTGDAVIYEIVDDRVGELLRLNADDHIVGLDEAPVTVIEYVDFACAGC